MSHLFCPETWSCSIILGAQEVCGTQWLHVSNFGKCKSGEYSPFGKQARQRVDSSFWKLCGKQCVHAKLLQTCQTLWDPMDSSLPSSSVHGILQAIILQWVAIPFSRGSSWLRAWTQVSCMAGRFFTIWATREAKGKPQGECDLRAPCCTASFSEWHWIKCSFTRTVWVSALPATPSSILTQQICSGLLLGHRISHYLLVCVDGHSRRLEDVGKVSSPAKEAEPHVGLEIDTISQSDAKHLTASPPLYPSFSSPFNLSSSFFSTSLCERVLSR